MSTTMNGPLIFTVLHIIKALECADQQATVGANITKSDRELNTTIAIGHEAASKSDQPDLAKLVKKACQCPCNSVPKVPVCGRTTNGLSRTFDSQCHLMCYNQCDGTVERYAITLFGSCPTIPALNRKNVFSNENRRIEYSSPYQMVWNPLQLYEDASAYLSNAYTPNAIYEVRRPTYTDATNSFPQNHDSILSTSSSELYETTRPSAAAAAAATTPPDTATKHVGADLLQYASQVTVETDCSCSHCPETRWIRLDYYPICGERHGQRRTFESWCHFDCENKCVRRTGEPFLYMHKGACAIENEEEIVAPRTVNVASVEICAACTSLCKNVFEPVCAKNSKNEFLSFRSRCHIRCHNQCHYQRINENFIPVYEGSCSWL